MSETPTEKKELGIAIGHPTRSPSLAALFEALSKAQGQFEVVDRNSENPFYKSRYADLAAVWKTSRKALAENGLTVIQTSEASNGEIYLRTTLAHKSGEWMDGILPLVVSKRDPQGVGSALTYARRYALSAIIGAAASEEDDDAETAQGRGKNEKKRQDDPGPPRRMEERRPVGEIAPTQKKDTVPRPVATFPKEPSPTEAQLTRLYALAAKRNWGETAVKSFMQSAFGKVSSKDLTIGEYHSLISRMQHEPPPVDPPSDSDELAATEVDKLSASLP